MRCSVWFVNVVDVDVVPPLASEPDAANVYASFKVVPSVEKMRTVPAALLAENTSDVELGFVHVPNANVWSIHSWLVPWVDPENSTLNVGTSCVVEIDSCVGGIQVVRYTIGVLDEAEMGANAIVTIAV
jgi:hypothetical protein